MEFGKVDLKKLEKQSFELPELNMRSSFEPVSVPPEVYVGCPVWANKNWIGETYPPGTQAHSFLKEYAKQFNVIELNSTHYRIPELNTLRHWRQEVGPKFKFSPKFPQEISHHLLVKGEAKNLSLAFLERMAELEENLGRYFVQLGPQFSFGELDRLKQFLDEIGDGYELALELRHPSWFTAEASEVLQDLLQAYSVIWLITDVAGRRDVLHLNLTQAALMVRFVGNALHPSDYIRMNQWLERLGQCLKMGVQEIYFFMHQPDNDLSPEACRYFIPKLNQLSGLNLVSPRKYPRLIQGSLF